MRQLISLNGVWKGWPGSKGPLSPEIFNENFLDLQNWLSIRVPSHWQTQKGFGRNEVVVYYATNFSTPKFTKDQSVLLEFKGVFYYFTVWLNGIRIAEHDAYFSPVSIDISQYLREDLENNLVLKVEWPINEDPDERETMTGVFGYWNSKHPSLHPGGVWRDVQLHIVDEVYLSNASIITSLTAFDSGNVVMSLDCTSTKHADIAIDWSLVPYNFQGDEVKGSSTRSMESGSNSFQIRFSINKPKLWWSWERGNPHLYTLTVKISHNDKLVDRYSKRIGFREVEQKDGIFYLNGERVFLRGTNFGPPDIYMSQVSRGRLEKDIQMILEANLNCVRVFGHVCIDEFYDICDENGLLVWQDIPLQYKFANHFKKKAIQHAIDLASMLQEHPAIISWCAHHEPFGDPSQDFWLSVRKWIAGSFNSWRRKPLGFFVEKALLEHDGSRPVIRYLGMTAFLCKGNNASSHYWGWATDNFSMLSKLMKFIPSSSRLISEYGAQAFPGTATMSNLGVSPDATKLDWAKLKRQLLVDKDKLDMHVPAVDYQLASSYFMATQNYQAKLLKFYHETWRKHKYAKCAGCFLYFFVDSYPGITWSIVDYYRRNKLAYLATQKAMQPVYVFADWPETEYSFGDEYNVSVYAVNDTMTAFMASALNWKITSEENLLIDKGKRVVDLTPDCLVNIVDVCWRISSDISPGKYVLSLVLELPTREHVSNSYEIVIERL